VNVSRNLAHPARLISTRRTALASASASATRALQTDLSSTRLRAAVKRKQTNAHLISHSLIL